MKDNAAMRRTRAFQKLNREKETLTARVQELEAENSRLGLALSDKQFEYAANLLAVESDKYGWDQLKARLAEAEGLLKIWMESITGGAEMNWTQDALRKFWKGCGAVEKNRDWMVGELRVSRGDRMLWFIDPSELPLSTLLDILERLARAMDRTKHGFLWDEIGVVRVDSKDGYTIRVRAYSVNHTQWLIDEIYPTREHAVIAAICALIDLKMPEGE